MNKFIKYDIENGLTLVKCGVRNILYALNEGEIENYKIDGLVSLDLIFQCMLECKWKVDTYDFIFTSPSGKRFDILMDTLENEIRIIKE